MRRTTALGFLCLALAAAAAEPPKRFTEVVKDEDGKEHRFDMVLIPAGTFTMGSPEGETGRKKDEGPQHPVRIKPFYLCTTETTISLWYVYFDEIAEIDERGRADPATEWREAMARVDRPEAITGPSPWYGDLTAGWGEDQRPMINVTWYHAMVFCNWLSLKTGRYYRLPTEAEWEYACRAGTKTRCFFGDDPDQLEDYAWFEDNSDDMSQKVAKKKPNPWGLYDMHGNVAEWCIDFYAEQTYAARTKDAPADGTKPLDKGTVHVVRGGAWDSKPEELRSAARMAEQPWWTAQDPEEPKSRWWLPRLNIIGFRVACEIPEK